MELIDIRKHQKLLHTGIECFTKLTTHYGNKSPYVKTTIKPSMLCGSLYNNFDLWNNQVCFEFHTFDNNWCSDFQISLSTRDIQDTNYLSWLLQHIDSRLWTIYDEFFNCNDKCGSVGKSVSRECGLAIFNELARDFKEAVN